MTLLGTDEPESSTADNSFLVPNPDATVGTAGAVDMAVLANLEGAQIDGEPDIVVELMELYLEDAAVKLAAMRGKTVGKNGLPLSRLAHSLRGSSANLGARGVSALCAELERASEDASSLGVEALLKSLEVELAHVRGVFEAECRRRA